jgi:hypothetical protein
MKKARLAILATLSLAATSLVAQSNALRPLIKMNVPFDFVAGGRTFPAGEYIVTSDRSNLAWIESADFKMAMTLVSHSAQDPKMAGVGAMRFNQYGTRYFLSQIWMGTEMGQQFPKSRLEREQIASSGTSHTVVAVTAKR